MSSGSSNGVGIRAAGAQEHGRESEERATEEQAARWAQALIPHLVPQQPPLKTPDAWRASDGNLTSTNDAGAAGPAAIADANTSSTDEPERVVMTVKTADLGELSLILDRSASGVRVLIGVADDALAHVGAERDALARQLRNSGVVVDSIQIVRQPEIGTVLAQARFTGRLRAAGVADRASAEERERVRRRGSRKLNFVG